MRVYAALDFNGGRLLRRVPDTVGMIFYFSIY
jgi:hypothetical protein